MKRLAWASIMAALASAASAQFSINEIAMDLPGTDNGQEFFEILGGPSASMSGLTLLIIEGDGAAAGTIDVALNLGSFSTGSNGLFLWRDSATVLSPAPEAETTVNVSDFNPDIENGTNSFMLVAGFSSSQGTDLDAGNDGTLDSTPWTSVLDAISVTENDGTAADEWVYADDVGGTVFPLLGFSPDSIVRLKNGPWVGVDVTGTSPGPFSWDPNEAVFSDGSTLDFNQLVGGAASAIATPGSSNAQLVPEPTTIAALALGAMGLMRRRLKR